MTGDQFIDGPELKNISHKTICGSFMSYDNQIKILVYPHYRFDTSTLMMSVPWDARHRVNLHWENGPRLPFSVGYGSLVRVGLSKLVLIGGEADLDLPVCSSYECGYLDTFLMLQSNYGKFYWELLNVTLAVPRYNHAAIMIPDTLVDC